MKNMKKKKTLLDTYLARSTFQERNRSPRTEGIIGTLSDIVERKGSFENLPQALETMHEFHRLTVDRSKVKDAEEHEKVATMMTLCFSMMLFDKHIADGIRRIKEQDNGKN